MVHNYESEKNRKIGGIGKSTFLDGFNMGTGTAWDVDDLVVLCGGTGGGLLPDNNLVPIMGKRCC